MISVCFKSYPPLWQNTPVCRTGFMDPARNTELYKIIIIIIIIIIILLLLFTAIGLLPGCSGYFTCIQNTKLVTTKFKSGELHEKHVAATWNLGNHLSICFSAQGNQEKPVLRWPVAGPSEYWPVASSPAFKVKKKIHIVQQINIR